MNSITFAETKAREELRVCWEVEDAAGSGTMASSTLLCKHSEAQLFYMCNPLMKCWTLPLLWHDSFSSTDLKFCSCSDDTTVKVWDFARCQEERSLAGTFECIFEAHWLTVHRGPIDGCLFP